jgi:hypothetical protein
MNERVWSINGLKLTGENLSNYGKTSPTAKYSTKNAVRSVLGSNPDSVAKGRPVSIWNFKLTTCLDLKLIYQRKDNGNFLSLYAGFKR